ncbi:hypothetical protein ACFLRY_02290, partial [Bacteroidota bacterium]
LKDITIFHDIKNKQIRTLLILLIVTDLVFVLLHLMLAFRVFYLPEFSLEMDLGYPEIFQYVKELWIVILFILIIYKSKNFAYVSWSFLFLFFLLDDSMKLHENFGYYFADTFNIQSIIGLRPNDIGEMVFFGIIGMIILLNLILFYRFSCVSFRNHSKNIFALILLLIFFGLFIDMLHIIVNVSYRINQLFGTIEDGGEMIVMSLILGYVYLLNINNYGSE